MIGICAHCGNYAWDKQVEGNQIRCPKCGFAWPFRKLPFYVITGCSGIGKTTTAMELQKMTDEFVIIDADLFYNIMQPSGTDENRDMLEQIFQISADIVQAGKPVVWTMAGSIDLLAQTYGKRFFSAVRVLALTAETDELRRRMTEGRGIDDDAWIQSSVDYNDYFRTHRSIGDMPFETLDSSGKSVHEVAMDIWAWLRRVNAEV